MGFRIMGLSINDSVYSSLFFFLTGLHFFHLLVGLFLLTLFFWGCSFPSKKNYFVSIRSSEVLLFYNLQLFYWHFLEIFCFFFFFFFLKKKKKKKKKKKSKSNSKRINKKSEILSQNKISCW